MADGIGLDYRDLLQLGDAPIQLGSERFGALFDYALPHLAETLYQPGFQLLNLLADPLIDQRRQIFSHLTFAQPRACLLCCPISLGQQVAQWIRRSARRISWSAHQFNGFLTNCSPSDGTGQSCTY